MEKPTLVILAAGMGSRYGGLKQIDPVDDKGHKIIDFSIYDAVRAGFGKVVFIIKKENEKDFRECVGDAVSKHIAVDYVFQELDKVPEGFQIPEGRVKPWGTAHAILCCKDVVKEPFAGICVTDEDGYLVEIAERTKIVKTEKAAAFTEDDGKTWTEVALDTPVSMNMWAFSPSIIGELQAAVDRFFAEEVAKNPLKSECFLPIEVDKLLKAGKATVEVLHSADKWFGVTYKEDKPFVMESIRNLKDAGVYPDVLW